MDLRIDPEFADKIPPLTQDEYDQLEANILADGAVINPLIIWNGVIVDGHNRYRIAMAHPEIPFRVYEKEFSDRYEAISWVCKNQLGRRNLTPEQKKYLIGKQYEAEKAAHGGERGTERDEEGQFTASGQNVHLRMSEKTSERIARETGTNERYVRRAEEFAKGLDTADEIIPGIRQEVFTGAIHPPDKAVIAVGKAPVEERKTLAEKLRHPEISHDSAVLSCEDSDPDTDDDDDEIRVPSGASIRTISRQMESGPNRSAANVDTEFIILELDDALNSMMHRWDTLIRDYRKEAMARDCLEKIKKLAMDGIKYFKKYTGENHK